MAPERVKNNVTVAASTPYEVIVEPALELADAVSAAIPPGTAVLLTDSTVGPLHAPAVSEALRWVGWNLLDTFTIPAGEGSPAGMSPCGRLTCR